VMSRAMDRVALRGESVAAVRLHHHWSTVSRCGHSAGCRFLWPVQEAMVCYTCL
jgi:hypothetical protein